MRCSIAQTNPVTDDFATLGGRRFSTMRERPEIEITITTADAAEAREIVTRLQGLRGFPVFPDVLDKLDTLDRNFPRRLDLE